MRAMLSAIVLIVGCTGGPTHSDSVDEGHPGEEMPVEASSAEANPTAASLLEVDAAGVLPLLKAQEAHVLLVNVWSTWCEPCMEEFPELREIGDEYASRGLGVVFISVDPNSQRDAALEFLVSQDAPMPSHIRTGSDQAFIRALHADWSGTIPATILFDRKRNARHFWERPVDRNTLIEPIEAMLTPSTTDGEP